MIRLIFTLFEMLFYAFLLEYFVLRSDARTFGISAGISIGLVLETLACLRYLYIFIMFG